MKKNKLLIGILSITLILGGMSGCSTNKTVSTKTAPNSEKAVKKEKVKAKCEANECIYKIEPTNSVEEVNKIIGVDGKVDSEDNNKYVYDLGNDEKITLKYYGEKATITAEYDKNKVANKKVNLSKLTELKPKVQSGITYDQFKAEIGNVDGTLYEKSESTNRYMWISTKGGSVRASFRNSDNKCSFFTGFGDTKK